MPEPHNHGTGHSSPPGGPGRDEHGSPGNHQWMMIACCAPMLLIVVLLVVAGIVSPVFLIVAVALTAAMALIMGGMHGGKRHR